MVSGTNTIHCPWAMMVHSQGTVAALTAMVGTHGLPFVAWGIASFVVFVDFWEVIVVTRSWLL